MTVMNAATPVSVEPDRHLQRRTEFEAGFDLYARSLYRYFAVRTGGDVHSAEDLMQQLWLKAATGETSVPAAEIEPWLRVIARNLIRTYWRKSAGRPERLPVANPKLARELAERLTGELIPPAVLERREVRDQLLLAITQLGAAEQELVIEHYFHGRSHAELAAGLGIGERAVEGRLYRARQSLRRMLHQLDS